MLVDIDLQKRGVVGEGRRSRLREYRFSVPVRVKARAWRISIPTWGGLG